MASTCLKCLVPAATISPPSHCLLPPRPFHALFASPHRRVSMSPGAVGALNQYAFSQPFHTKFYSTRHLQVSSISLLASSSCNTTGIPIDLQTDRALVTLREGIRLRGLSLLLPPIRRRPELNETRRGPPRKALRKRKSERKKKGAGGQEGGREEAASERQNSR